MSVQRARPSLGTLVQIRVEGQGETVALRAIDAAFAEVAQIHRLMSFHDAGSDLARVHRARIGEQVSIDARTREVLACALRVAAASGGAFDPTVAARQVERGYLPRPVSAFAPDPGANWHDIELLEDAVILRKPLWLDLGGIAKGYAVDRAIDILIGAGAQQACVNAGGDLRLAGARAERVRVRDGNAVVIAAVELADAAIATSTTAATSHLDGESGESIAEGASVAVVASTCMVADALTKVVLAKGVAAGAALACFAAQARRFAPCRSAA